MNMFKNTLLIALALLDISITYAMDRGSKSISKRARTAQTGIEYVCELVQKNDLETIKTLYTLKNPAPKEVFCFCNFLHAHTPIIIASFFGNIEIIKYLINVAGFDPNENGVLHMAAVNGHYDVVKYLIEVAKLDTNATIDDRLNVVGRLIEKARINKKKLYPGICSAGTGYLNSLYTGWTALHLAAISGHRDLVKYLIEEAKADVNKVDKDGLTALHLAAVNGQEFVVKYLIEETKVDANKVDNNDLTVLHLAAANGHRDLVKYLIEKAKVDANKVDKDGWTALHLAAVSGQEFVVKYLIEETKVDANKVDEDGWTVLHLAAANGHTNVVKYLIEKAKADANKLNGDGGWTALHLAAANGHTNVVKYLIEKAGIDTNKVNINGWTPLLFAAREGHTDVVKYLIEEAKADANKLNKDGDWTALHLAIINGRLEVVQLIVQDKNLVLNKKAKTIGKEELSPIELAIMAKKHAIVDFLRTFVADHFDDECGICLEKNTDLAKVPYVFDCCLKVAHKTCALDLKATTNERLCPYCRKAHQWHI